MSKSTKDFFETISSFCYISKMPYSFKSCSPDDDKYYKGIFTVYDWVDELCYYYLKKEQNLKSDFLSLLEEKHQQVYKLNDSKYKSGMIKGFDELYKVMTDL